MISTFEFGIIGALRALCLALALCSFSLFAESVATGQSLAKGATTTSAQASGQVNTPQALKININKAGAEELTKLPRIGPKIAERILEFRKEHGAFKKAEELMNVKGIGEKTFARLKDQITL